MTLLTLANRVYDSALAVVYPQACAICGNSVESRFDGVACAACWDATSIFVAGESVCWKCGALSPAKVAEARREHLGCGRCDDNSFDAARACGNYEGALRASILQLKRQPHVPRRLLELLLAFVRRPPLNCIDLILPVPLHARRERERGFNQALVLATELSRAAALPIDEHCLVRKTETHMHRGGMDAKARRRSVAGAFTVRHADLVAGQRLLLIDDVFTTGATVSACAAELKTSGASEVLVLTVARA